jgi:hypothetical protein
MPLLPNASCCASLSAAAGATASALQAPHLPNPARGAAAAASCTPAAPAAPPCRCCCSRPWCCCLWQCQSRFPGSLGSAPQVGILCASVRAERVCIARCHELHNVRLLRPSAVMPMHSARPARVHPRCEQFKAHSALHTHQLVSYVLCLCVISHLCWDITAPSNTNLLVLHSSHTDLVII